MLTIDYDRFDVRPGMVLLDIGAGLGRHAYEAARRGAGVVVADLSDSDMKDVRAVLVAMIDKGEAPPTSLTGTLAGDAVRLPFRDDVFDRVIASEVLEHISDDAAAFAELARVVKPGGAIAVTVPSVLPETICWKLSDEYYAPKAVGGHVRIYRRRDIVDRLRSAGLEPIGSHRSHALHSPYWWLRCAVGLQNETNRFVAGYKRFLEWDIMKQPVSTRVAERILDPVLGKSLVVYARKPPR